MRNLTLPHYLAAALLSLLPYAAAADEPDSLRRDLLRETVVSAEISATTSTGDYAPLWLSANRYGLSSVRPHSAYLRAAIERDIVNDSARDWRFGYGLDLALAAAHERTGILQQAYIQGAWKKITLTIGAKQRTMATQNAELASGALAMGINARPIPQVRLDIDWFPFPWTRRWWQWRLYGAFGWTTDGRWQQQWVRPGERYARHTRYHEKALFWRFGREDIFPLTFDFGLQMATQFGGDSYNIKTTRINDNQYSDYHYDSGLKAYWQALTQQGSDNTDGTNPNVAGNTLGSYVMQLRYQGPRWQARAYWERFFEDHSMLTLQYGIRDMLVGAEVTAPRNPYVTSAVVEYMGSTDQSGPIFHDETPNMPVKIAGRDDYYNHNLYAGWQHYGQPIGNPFITAPLYNKALAASYNGPTANADAPTSPTPVKGQASPTALRFYNNRVRAWHMALAGDPAPQWHWRAMASITRNWGSYAYPQPEVMSQQYFMAEATFSLPQATSRALPSARHDAGSAPFTGWQFSLALGLDHGDLIGNSFGAQLTIRKSLTLKP